MTKPNTRVQRAAVIQLKEEQVNNLLKLNKIKVRWSITAECACLLTSSDVANVKTLVIAKRLARVQTAVSSATSAEKKTTRQSNAQGPKHSAYRAAIWVQRKEAEGTIQDQ